MKKQLKQLKLFLAALLILTATGSHAQQEYTLTTTTANISSANALIDVPGLSGKNRRHYYRYSTGKYKNNQPPPNRSLVLFRQVEHL
ncbi:MAG: hypothetical protein IPQ06_13880 [Chitinophagaceae bacterium]|nr:hypothetical protein [Chitinophagaceae bacterium]